MINDFDVEAIIKSIIEHIHLPNRKTAANALQDRQPRQPIISSCQP
jgi:hypothetical protein